MSAQPNQAAKKANQTTRKKVTVPSLIEMKARAEPIAMLTCYDACFASVLDHAGVDIQLVGDSLGMVLAGMDSTLPVTMEHMQYHTRCVAAGNEKSLVLADMPFGSYQKSPAQAYENAARLLEAGAQMVKLEGNDWLAPTIEFLAARDIPVCAHLGLTPQSIHALGGYKVQGKGDEAGQKLLASSLLMQESGADLMLYEMIPCELAENLTKSLKIPTIGIGAGNQCDGQVLVLHDMLNVYPGKKARFVRNFMEGASSIEQAVTHYVQAVKDRSFPGPEHVFTN
ncbi:MAG: 3-methyl-2-oxobutanoate hydroxymethyltransferase [Limnobacter sp.]|nr:3-methyl-2-oxobutanoate hydroxymethyltransferase [Limnobacter sp.]